MNIKRERLGDLNRWKNSRYRKPLVLQGARQVGKSFILKQFGELYFENYHNHLSVSLVMIFFIGLRVIKLN
jgi:predicted AAA+ superfamily ATPase